MRLLSMCLVVGILFAGLGFSGVTDDTVVEQPVKEDMTVKEIMGMVMKGGMLKKAMKGEATDEEKMKILDALIMFSESEATQGDADEYTAMTQKVMSDYAKVLVGREGAVDALKASTNCKACHDKFKG